MGLLSLLRKLKRSDEEDLSLKEFVGMRCHEAIAKHKRANEELRKEVSLSFCMHNLICCCF